MATKPTKAQIKAREEAKALRNPLTGQQPNSFTQVTNRDLPAPRNVQTRDPDVGLQRRTRKAADAYLRGDANKAPQGYRLDAIDPQYRTFVTGANHMLPNTAKQKGVPAINEPHEADPGVTVQRRAEDLSGKEVRKGLSTLKQYGHDPKNPMESLKEVHRQAIDHATAQHIAAGVHESASQMFYGGTPTTTGMDHDLESLDRHESGVMAANDRFHQASRSLAQHPDFVSQTSHLAPRERQSAATRLTAQSVADTSPNSKWRDTPGARYQWPNIEQAEEANKAAVEGGPVKFITGRVQNHQKAKERVQDAVDTKNYDVHQHGDVVSAPKTVAFRGALANKDAADAFKVTDVHEASIVAPWLDTAKAHMHARFDESGEQVGHQTPVYKDTPKAQRRGLTPLTKEIGQHSGYVKEVPKWGLSRPEAMLSESRSTVHALNDRATREVLTERGLSRGVNYADNVHSAQGMAWGLQQSRRADVNVSPADQYPVRRNWQDEGINVPAAGDIRAMGSAHTNLSPQFVPNSRTGRTQSIWPEDH